MATDDAEPPFGDGSRRAATAQSTTDLTRRDQLRGWVEYIADLGRVERYGFAGVLVTAAGSVVAADQVLGVSQTLITAGFASVFTLLMLATVIVLTVDGSEGANTDESTGPGSGRSSLEQWRRGRRRP